MNLLLPTQLAVAMLAALAALFAGGAYGLGLWHLDMPGPGLLPLAAALALLLLIYFLLKDRVQGETPFKATPLYAIILTCGYAAVVPYTGFLFATFLVVALWVRFFDRQSWLISALMGASLTAAAAFVFVVLLNVPAPLLPGWL